MTPAAFTAFSYALTGAVRARVQAIYPGTVTADLDDVMESVWAEPEAPWLETVLGDLVQPDAAGAPLVEELFGIDALTAATPFDRPQTDSDLIRDCLLDSGVPERYVAVAVIGLEPLIEELTLRQGGAALADLLWRRLGNTVAGTAFIRLLLESDVPLRQEAARLGCSHVALINATKKLRRLFQLPSETLLLE